MSQSKTSERVVARSSKLVKLRTLLISISQSSYLPHILAIAAFIIMIPALFGGMFGDDMIQGLTQRKRADLPERVFETGLVSTNCGTLSGVANDLFGYLKYPEQAQHAADYGIAPWWASLHWQAALWRPVTAFTHWLDYRIFPKTPWLMHLHNVFWFVGIVFMVTIIYRLIGRAGTTQIGATSSITNAAALGAFLFLLDKNTYFPVMYVANRGFFVALFFGLVSLYAHHQWRLTRRKVWMCASVTCLLLAMLANEAGVSTMAFLIAYALVLEPTNPGLRQTARSILTIFPAVVAVIAWRIIYVAQNCGVKNFEGYIDPGYSPLLFLKNLLPRTTALLGGQLSGVMPEINFGLNPASRLALGLFFLLFVLVCGYVFLPTIRRNVVARFWAVVMLLALVPAATVAPISKNLGFVAIGAFGLMSVFFVQFAQRHEREMLSAFRRAISWGVVGWLLLAHIFGAVAARGFLGFITPFLGPIVDWGFEHLPDGGDRNVVVVNDPGPVYALVPIYRAYRGGALPKSVKNLALGLTGLRIMRSNDSTLIVTAKSGGLLSAPAFGPVHVAYACKTANDFLYSGMKWKKGDRVVRKGWTIEVIDTTEDAEPRSVAIHFDSPLEADNRLWLQFVWRPYYQYVPFKLPKVGETVEVAGPRGRK
ncbi:MAG: hypothetical protein JWO95_491 [Verrucomicrobiales bacterium]|nr:hypothetical protein [Verrucomicrobiales bacterium]